jgi:hypothetical protein
MSDETPRTAEYLSHFRIVVVCKRCDRQYAPSVVDVDDSRTSFMGGLVTVGFGSQPVCPMCAIAANAPGGDA